MFPGYAPADGLVGLDASGLDADHVSDEGN